MPNRNGRSKRGRALTALDLAGKVAERGGQGASCLGLEQAEDPSNNDTGPSAGLFGRQRLSSHTAEASFRRTRLFATPFGSRGGTAAKRLGTAKSTKSDKSRFSRGTVSSSWSRQQRTADLHVVCAVSENLAGETCVASLDAGSATVLQITQQGNGQTYAETLACLAILQPHEVLLNEGRRHSPLARKILQLYHHNDTDAFATVAPPIETQGRRRQRQRRFAGGTEPNYYDDEEEQRPSSAAADDSATVVKFLSRAFFDQTKGAQLLRKIAREETYDATVVDNYILLSSAHAVLQYTQQSLGASFTKNCLHLQLHSGITNNRMTLDRSTILQLELLVNSKTGKVRDSLIGTLDNTKTTVGSRLLRTNLISPPTRVDTIHSRLELVDTFLGNEDFFYTVLEHLSSLPDVDKMLTNVALVPRKAERWDGDTGAPMVNQRIAGRGISALVCIKSTLSGLPAFAGALQAQLDAMDPPRDESATPAVEAQQQGRRGDETVSLMTDRTSLLIGLGGGQRSTAQLQRHHLLRAIIFSMTQPALGQVLAAVSDIFTETTTFSRNSNAMRHQECFALKAEEETLMSVLRKAFLANVDDIYKKADEYAEVHGFQVAVRYSASRGYYLAVPVDVGMELPDIFLQPAKSGRFINCTTQEITSLNTRAQDNVNDLLIMTHDQIQGVLDVARTHYDAIAALCDAVALLDMCHSFADTVTLSQLPWCRPLVSEQPQQPNTATASAAASASTPLDSGDAMVLRNGRYGISVTSSGVGPDEYVPNDTCAMEGKNFTLVTGINGSGKSTYLKQVAIIVILAHCGSYVPAEQASIPIRDQLCTRIGNTDDSEHNISTFMLEMKETAFICNQVTDKSLVLIDELGRATSNEDGVAIAWSVAEYLLKKRCMTFFVTHYPQLCRLGHIYPAVQNVHLEAAIDKGDDGKISYTHVVKVGPCSVSTDYGVELAASCGWRQDVVQNARESESEVEALLPSHDLCESQSSNSQSDPRVKAYDVVETICRSLKGLLSDDEPRSLGSIRAALVELHQNTVPTEDTALLGQVDKLLFRASDNSHLSRLLSDDRENRSRSVGGKSGPVQRESEPPLGSQVKETSGSNPLQQDLVGPSETAGLGPRDNRGGHESATSSLSSSSSDSSDDSSESSSSSSEESQSSVDK